MHERRSNLLFVGLNPPLTSGVRTSRRVELAGELLGFAEVTRANLFAKATRDSVELAQVGHCEDDWRIARDNLAIGLQTADAVLLAYGVTAPAEPARAHFKAQVSWLDLEIDARGLAVWQVGEAPRHPSRWQRYTYRVTPDLPFREALRRGLQKRPALIRVSPDETFFTDAAAPDLVV